MEIRREEFGHTGEGREVFLFTLRNDNGIEVRLCNLGGIVVSLHCPDRNGKVSDVVLGFDKLDGYLAGHPYFGALCGRYANRIARARFVLDGTTYRLAANDGRNHLHGGRRGFDKAVWNANEVIVSDRVGVQLDYLSRDGEEGYPGNLSVSVIYSLGPTNDLRLDYFATSDRSTPVNLTHHGYFNLKGHDRGDILGHRLQVFADRYCVLDEELIPTGEMRSVAGTPFDFRKGAIIGSRIGDVAGGYDLSFALKRRDDGPALAAKIWEPESGRLLEVLTTEPALQLYTGNFLDGKVRGKGEASYQRHAGFCLEAQHFADSPNQPGFPSTILLPAGEYHQRTVYRFGSE